MANQMQPGGNPPRMSGPRPPMPVSAGAMTPKEIFGIIRRHLFMIVFFTILGTMAGGGGWYLLRQYQPKYTAVGSIEVLPGDLAPDDYYRSNLNQDLAFNLRSTLAFQMKQQGFLQELLKIKKVYDTDWYAGFNKDLADLVEDLRKNLGASAQRDKDLIVVSMTCGNAGEAALIVDEAIDLFIRQKEQEAKAGTRAKLNIRDEQLKRVKRDFDQVEDKLRAQRVAANFSKLDKSNFRDYLDDRLRDVERNRDELESNIKNITETVNILTARRDREILDDVVRERIETDQAAITMRLSVDRRKVELERLKSQFGARHKRVIEAAEALKIEQERLEQWKNSIAELVVGSQLINAMEQQTIAETELTERSRQAEAAREEYRNINKLRANYEMDLIRRDELQAQLEEINNYIEGLNAILNDPTLSKVKLGYRAQAPLEMSSPKLLIFGPGGFMLGFLLGVGLAFAVEMLNDLLRTPSSVMKNLRIPLLGTICHQSEDRSVRKVNLYQIVRDAPYSIISECYRQFRVNLKLSGSGGSHKSLLVTSGESGDGKTSVAANLAYTMVAENRRVLLIDTNFRKPTTTKLFADSTNSDSETADVEKYGLSDYLMAMCDQAKIIRRTDVEGLFVVDSGPLPLNSSELLGCDRMKLLLKKASEVFDYVIVDGPPLLVSEAKSLAAQTDGTILVFNTDTTRKGAAQRSVRELKEINADIAGCVLLGVRSMKGGYFQEVYKSYKRYQKVKPKAAVL